ncbi:peptidase G2 autoproteolytic cleavage domain-containing protein [Bacillus atrophaeus]|uniref:peptidase G2 autoproteolytic cleavage domain-containing protein n=1 Tax=Bacillus atrophaeus TaxID=1452 RepID=UPI002E240327|nr:peptidase G2 autoproteolytic cleavage domain-containing protein [Bacillus atrophaeus]
MNDNLIPVNTMGYMDEKTEQWIPIDAIGLKSNNIRYTADDIQEAFDKASKDIKNVISTVDSGLTDITNTIGDISKIPASGATIVDKVLNEFIRRSVNVKDFGAKGDGVTDDSEAFKAAFASGKREVFVPAGMYMVQGLHIPSYVRLYGVGSGSIIKLHPTAAGTSCVLTNSDYTNGNEYILIEDLDLDWNLDKKDNTITNGTNANCVGIVNSKFVRVRNVNARNPGVHGFDVSSPVWNSSIDGAEHYQPNGSKYVWIENCTATNYGDDGFTTHYSDYIFFTNCYAYDANGSAHSKGSSNSNGFEIDDGSKNVWLVNCYSRKNCRGFEVKAHNRAPAARNVNLINCYSENDIRAFDFRHIGFHLASEKISTSAFDINVVNCTAQHPIFSDLYQGLNPRALVVSAYRNVNISNFNAIGDPTYDYKNTTVISTQYKSRNINLNNITVAGFTTASNDIYVIGGAQKSDNVNISNVTINQSALVGIAVGSKVGSVNISNANLIGTSKTGSVGVYCTNSQVNINSVMSENYSTPSKIAGKTYSFIPNNFKGGTRIATTSGYAKTKTSVVMASSGGGQATGDASAVIATTGGSKAEGPRNAVIASSGGSKTTSEGSRSLIGASNNSRIEGAGSSRTVLASQGVVNKTGYTVALGYGTSSTPSTANTKIQLHAKDGNITLTGQVKGASTFADYAEYFESADGRAIATGYMVTLEGDKIRKANLGEKVLGVISETAGVVLGESLFNWQGKYLRNEFGGLIYEDVDVIFINSEGVQVTETRRLPKENPEFNSDEEYVPRSERPEWNIVGMFGQIYVRVDETVQDGDRIIPKAGKGSKSTDGTGYPVMKVTTPYTKERGFGVAVCLVAPMM